MLIYEIPKPVTVRFEIGSVSYSKAYSFLLLSGKLTNIDPAECVIVLRGPKSDHLDIWHSSDPSDLKVGKVANRLSVIATIVSLISTSVAAETQWRFGANLVSFHVASTEEFNEFNPGAFLSVSFRSEHSFQYGLQFGGYSNSFGERTLYGLAFANWHLLDMNRAELRAGVFAGLFEYPNLVESANDAGWPTVGDMVLALGPSLALRLDNGIDVTIGYLPVNGKATKGVITLQTSITF